MQHRIQVKAKESFLWYRRIIKPPEVRRTFSPSFRARNPDEELHIVFTSPGPQYLHLLESIPGLIKGARIRRNQGLISSVVELGRCGPMLCVCNGVQATVDQNGTQSLARVFAKELIWYYGMDALYE